MSDSETNDLELDEQGNPRTVSNEKRIFPTYSHITDPSERAEAYEEVAKKNFDLLNSERKLHLKDSKENTKLIRVQEKDIVELQTKNRSLPEHIQDIETQNQENKKLSEELTTELQTISDQLKNAKALLQQNNIKAQENEDIMNLEVKDVIAGIPVFSGDPKQLEGFVNACDIYYSLAEQNQKAGVLSIIKAKITGEALAKAGPFDNELNTWDLLKTRLNTKIKKQISFEYAQEDLNNVFQKKEESIEDYGTRVKTKLRHLNEACRTMATTDAEKKILRKANEKQAIS